MKSLLKILFAPLIWLIQACSPLGKPVDANISDSYFYNPSRTDVIYSSMGNWFELGKSPLNADAETFKVFNRHIGKDKDKAYYQWLAVDYADLDLESFHAKKEDWMWHIGLDKHRVYVFNRDVIDGEWQLITKVIEEADPQTFIQIDLHWAEDGQRRFYRDKVIDVDYSSFEVINNFFTKDSSQVYLYYQDRFAPIAAEAKSTEKIDDLHIRDASHVYVFLDYLRREEIAKLKTIPYTDFNRVKISEKYHLVVEDRVYYHGVLVEGANAEALKVISEQYAKDDQHVYYEGLLVEGADAETFHFDEGQFIYRDKNQKYREGKVWNEDNEEQASLEESDQKVLKAGLMDTDAEKPESFKVTISSDKEVYKKGEEIMISMIVENTSYMKDEFCNYHTPFEGIQNNIFTVVRGNKEIPYQGMMKKRIPPTADDYQKLKPGKSVKCSVEMEGYDMDRKGDYTIQFTGNMISGLPASNQIEISIK
ncbi:MAG: DKNYY domain-containing protein [Bacteroidota bacterium]